MQGLYISLFSKPYKFDTLIEGHFGITLINSNWLAWPGVSTNISRLISKRNRYKYAAFYTIPNANAAAINYNGLISSTDDQVFLLRK